jgi:hypothetical protein
MGEGLTAKTTKDTLAKVRFASLGGRTVRGPLTTTRLFPGAIADYLVLLAAG